MIGIAGVAVLLASTAAGLGSFALAWYLARHRDSAGAKWFMATLISQSVWVFAYTTGFLVDDLLIRAYAEAIAWGGMVSLGPLFLGFALEYTGRSNVVRTRWFKGLFVFPLGTLALGLTHPLHGLLWQNIRFERVFGLSTLLYEIQPLGYVGVLVGLSAAGVGGLLLVETILTYGPLYRREALAVAFSTVPPTVPLFVWLLGVGPYPSLNFAVVALIPHVALDGYAFVGTHMFETNPTTQRAAEQSALDDLNDPLVVVDTDAQVVNLNERARELFGIEGDSTLPLAFEELTGTGLDAIRQAGELSVEGSDGGVFAVSYTQLTDPNEQAVGGMVVLYDLSDQRRREQQLSVLNRVLRHNLRNELTVVRGHAQSMEESAADPELQTQADLIVDSSDRLLDTARKARDFNQVRKREVQFEDVDPEALLSDVRDDLRECFPDATIAFDVTPETVRTDSRLLSAVLSNLLENALDHADRPDPTVTVRVDSAAQGEAVTFTVRDDNDAIADNEIAPLRQGAETPTEHASGIGLWVANWCVSALNGDITFEYDDGNVVTVTIPTSAREGTTTAPEASDRPASASETDAAP